MQGTEMELQVIKWALHADGFYFGTAVAIRVEGHFQTLFRSVDLLIPASDSMTACIFADLTAKSIRQSRHSFDSSVWSRLRRGHSSSLEKALAI
jgi:hypothetical protein